MNQTRTFLIFAWLMVAALLWMAWGQDQAAQRQAATLEGTLVCPEGAALFAAAAQLRESGWIRPGARVVALNTGAGIKYPDTFEATPPVLQPGDRLPR